MDIQRLTPLAAVARCCPQPDPTPGWRRLLPRNSPKVLRWPIPPQPGSGVRTRLAFSARSLGVCPRRSSAEPPNPLQRGAGSRGKQPASAASSPRPRLLRTAGKTRTEPIHTPPRARAPCPAEVTFLSAGTRGSQGVSLLRGAENKPEAGDEARGAAPLTRGSRAARRPESPEPRFGQAQLGTPPARLLGSLLGRARAPNPVPRDVPSARLPAAASVGHAPGA